jgi:hypothetical protein
MKNLLNFHETFKELNMLSVWEYRNELIKWFWDVTIDFDGDTINKTELIKIWNRLLDFINNVQNEDSKWNKSRETTVWWVKNKLIGFSWARSDISDEKKVNSYWDDPFKALLREHKIIWDWIFKYNKFREILNWNI